LRLATFGTRDGRLLFPEEEPRMSLSVEQPIVIILLAWMIVNAVLF
jgi:hypothetical protein